MTKRVYLNAEKTVWQDKRQTFEEQMMECTTKECLQKEFEKLSKQYNYQATNMGHYRQILDSESNFVTSNPQKQYNYHKKQVESIEKKMKIIKEVACKKFDVYC